MHIHFVLVEPAVPENVGAAARALKTMGFDSLWLVNTRAHLDPKAGYVAHASKEILEQARTFDSFSGMLDELDFSIATSAKSRHVRQEYYMAGELPQVLNAKAGMIDQVGVIFGREEYGLKNGELERCDIISRLPMHTSYPSLNLAQTVMVYSYLLASGDPSSGAQAADYNRAQLKALKSKVEQILPLIDLPETTNIYNRILERLMHATTDDVHLLHTICNEVLKKLPKE